MPFKVDLMESGGGDDRPTVRVDVWNPSGEHWVTYFHRNDAGRLNLVAAATTRANDPEEALTNDDVTDTVRGALRHYGFELAEDPG